MRVVREFQFDAAHMLPNHPGRCRNLHGHTYRLQVWCEGPVDETSGMVVDFGDVKRVVEARVLSVLDHNYLNDHIENPTAERIVLWVADRLEGQGLPVSELWLYETPSCFVVHKISSAGYPA